MRHRRLRLAAAGLSAVALLGAAACGGSSGGSGGGGASAVSINGCTPENPLIGGATSEACGGNIVSAITSGLVHYDTETSKPVNDIAQSIETTDNKLFTVKIKPGYLFSDGTEVKAKNFVDAWNYTAYGPNGQQGSYFFEPIKGFDDTQCADEKCETKPKADTLAGLKVVDDHTFTIETTQPVSNLPVRLGYSAFVPQPDAFFADTSEGKKTFAAKPVTSGPYVVSENTPEQVVLTKNPQYKGEFAGHVDKVTFRVYQDPTAAYNDVVAGNLDVIDQINTDQLVNDIYKQDLPDRNASRELGQITYATFSPKDPQLKNPDLRKAFSMAVDRHQIASSVLSNSAAPADGWVSPSVEGYVKGQCGEACTFDPAKAKALYQKAGGYKGTLTVSANLDGASNKSIYESVCNQLKNNLGVDCRFNGVVDFATYNKGLRATEYSGVLRNAWVMDYPSIENFLAPIYSKGAASNFAHYDNPAFERKLAEAAAQKDPQAANAGYQEAERMIAADLPTFPLLVPKGTYGWSDRVAEVKMRSDRSIDVSSIKLK